MNRGEVWWVELGERRRVVLLSDDGRAVQVVEPSGVDIDGLGIEVPVLDGVVRVGFPRPGFTLCTWETTVTVDDLLERAGTVPQAKLDEIEDALRAEPPAPSPDAVTRLGEIRDALRRAAAG